MNPSTPSRLRSLFFCLLLPAAVSGAADAVEPIFTIPLDNELPVGVDLHEPPDAEPLPLGPKGSGVSGAPDSVAFDNTSATGMGYEHRGVENQGRLIFAPPPLPELADISSFTICGWFQAEEVDGSRTGARLVSTRRELKAPGIELLFQRTALCVLINDQSFESAKLQVNAGEWTFFAVTADFASNSVKFFIGNQYDAVALIDERTTEPGTHISAESPSLAIGNSPQYTRPFKGLVDRVRIFATGSGPEAALDETQLEAIRAADSPQ